MRVGFFDSAGKCLCILSGDQTSPVVAFTYHAEVPDELTPNTCAYDPATGKVVEIEHVLPDPPVSTRLTAEQLEVRVKKLEERIANLRTD